MEFEITNYNNFFELKGILSKRNIEVFHSEFNHVFNHFNAITISIENVEWMDKTGVDALANLHYESLEKNKSLSIIGFGCKDLYNHFKAESAA